MVGHSTAGGRDALVSRTRRCAAFDVCRMGGLARNRTGLTRMTGPQEASRKGDIAEFGR